MCLGWYPVVPVQGRFGFEGLIRWMINRILLVAVKVRGPFCESHEYWGHPVFDSLSFRQFTII